MVTPLVGISDGVRIWVDLGCAKRSFFFCYLNTCSGVGITRHQMHASNISWVTTSYGSNKNQSKSKLSLHTVFFLLNIIKHHYFDTLYLFGRGGGRRRRRRRENRGETAKTNKSFPQRDGLGWNNGAASGPQKQIIKRRNLRWHRPGADPTRHP